MKSLLSYLLPIGFLLSLIGTPVTAQVTTDNTTDTTVNAEGNNFTIQNGDTAGSNLFHSFQDFSVPNGGSAFFDNAEAIRNIFSRVTGGNISNIDGLIRANDANLFLINPAGIIFGAGARLDLGGGSFYGSSADSILFEDGEFSASDLENPPLITVNAPIGLSFRDNPGAITNNSVADDVGLQVASGATLALLGGNINFTGGIIDSPGANIFLGGLSEAGTINLDDNLNPSFPVDVTKANVSLSEQAFIDVSGTNENGGLITFNANNINLDLADLDSTTFGTGDAGNINLNADNNLDINASRIASNVQESATGKGGQITLTGNSITLSEDSTIGAVTTTNAEDVEADRVRGGDIEVNVSESLSITGSSGLISSTQSQGNAGNITINGERADIVFEDNVSEGEDNAENSGSGSIFSSSLDGDGDAGDINITAKSLTLRDDSLINSSAFGGTGDGGDITINVAENIDLTNVDIGSDSASSNEDTIPQGNAGNITINSDSLSASDNSVISSTTFGTGDAGDIAIDTNNNLELSSSNINSSVQESATGKGGLITISGQSISLSEDSRIGAVTFPDGENLDSEQVRGGDIELNVSESLSITEDSVLISSTVGKGNAGNITINGEEADIVFEDKVVEGNEEIDSSGAIFSSSRNANGDAGDITITAKTLTLRDDGFINSSVFGGTGEGGNITFNVAENLDIIDFFISSAAFLNEEIMPTGNAGNITINAGSFSFSGENFVSTNTFGEGKAGNIAINADSVALSDNARLTSNTSGAGNAGSILIDATTVSLSSGADLNSSTSGTGNSGEVRITADGTVKLSDAGTFIFSNVEAGGTGDSLGVFIDAQSLDVTDGAQIQTLVRGASGEIPAGEGNAGDININVRDEVNFVGSDFSETEQTTFVSTAVSQLSPGATGRAGNIIVTAKSLSISDGAELNTSTFGNGDAGNITINIQDEINLSGFIFTDDRTNTFPSFIRSVVGFDGKGNAGIIDISANSLSLSNRVQINTSTFGNGNAGNIALNINDAIDLERSSFISSNVSQRGIGDAGNIDIQTGSLTLNTGSQIGTAVIREGFEIPGGVGNGGNITINATDFVNVSGVGSEQIELLDTTGDPENTTGLVPTGIFSSGIFVSSGSGALGDAGDLNVTTNEFKVADGAIVSGITANEGQGGNIVINANTLEATGGGQILTTTSDSGNAGKVTIDVSDQIDISGSDSSFEARLARANEFGSIQGERNIVANQGAESGIFANTSADSTGNGGSISIGSGETGFTNEITLSDEGRIAADSQGSGNGGQVTIRAGNLSLSEAEILAETTAEQPQDSSRSEINLFIDETLTLKDNSTISAQAINNARGGNVNIDAGFIVAFPLASGDGNDILASASGEGTGGDINIETRQIFGLEENQANANNASNDIDASSEFGLDGNVTITIFDPTAIEGATELPTNTVEAEAIAANVCSADNTVAGTSSLIIQGKGGIPPEPIEPLSSDVINTAEPAANNDSETNGDESVSIDDIVPARGVKVTEAGQVILTAYPVDNQGDRLGNSTPNCS